MAAEDFKIPKGLSKHGRAVATTIMRVLRAKSPDGKPDAGGCKVFYTPQEWTARGEQYGCDSELIIVYDGGEHARFFDYNEECYKDISTMEDAVIDNTECFIEACTCWYAAAYKR